MKNLLQQAIEERAADSQPEPVAEVINAWGYGQQVRITGTVQVGDKLYLKSPSAISDAEVSEVYRLVCDSKATS